MKNREEIYKSLYDEMKKEFANPSIYFIRYNHKLSIEDNASRMANIFAVKNTEWVYQNQFKKEK